MTTRSGTKHLMMAVAGHIELMRSMVDVVAK